MRCGTVATLYAFATSGTTTKTAYTVVTVGAEGATCTAAQYVVIPQAEFDNAIASPFRLTIAEGGAVGGAILLLWALAFAFRAAVRVVMHTDTPPSHD